MSIDRSVQATDVKCGNFDLTTLARELFRETVGAVVEETITRLVTEGKLTVSVQTETKKEEPPVMWDRKQTASFLHVSLPTLHGMIHRGLLTPSKAGQRTLFDSAEVTRAVAEGRLGRYARTTSKNC